MCRSVECQYSGEKFGQLTADVLFRSYITCLQSLLPLKLTLLCAKPQFGSLQCWKTSEVQRVSSTKHEGVLRLLHRPFECGLKYSCMVFLSCTVSTKVDLLRQALGERAVTACQLP